MWFFLLIAALLALGLFYAGRTWLGWVLPTATLYVGWWIAGATFPFLYLFSASLLGLVAVIGGVPRLRRDLLTRAVLPRMRPILPRMSETERIAIEAGSGLVGGRVLHGSAELARAAQLPPH